jgi:excisionase family DNA binding protein
MSVKELNSDSKYLTVDDVAALMKVSIKTVYNWCSKGYLPCVKFGRLVRINKEEFLSRIEELKEASSIRQK